MSKKLLLADDSVTIQRVIELTFAGEDVQVLTAGDGEEAIARIPRDKPDIVLADIGMPKRSGYEVSAFVKNNPETEKIPVLLLAGAFEPVDDAKAKEAKCDGVLVKPFEPQHVIARVRELIGGAKGSPSSQAVPDIPRPAAVLAPPRPVELPKREERPPVPDDLMDLGDEDLLPREDMLQHVEDVETASQPIVMDDSLDDYFDKLDEAFATINTPAGAGGSRPEPRAARPDRPVLERDLESFDEAPFIVDMPAPAPAPRVAPPAALADSSDPFAGIDAFQVDEPARVPTLDDLLAGMPPAPEPAHVIDFPPPPVSRVEAPPTAVAPPPIEPPDLTATLSPAPAPEPTVDAAPPPPAAPPAASAPLAPPISPEPAPPAAPGRMLADAFSALLAAEQGEPGAAPPRFPGSGSQPLALDESTLDEIARRVIARLATGSPDQMQQMVREIVSAVAERLVREEIQRIRNSRQ